MAPVRAHLRLQRLRIVRRRHAVLERLGLHRRVEADHAHHVLLPSRQRDEGTGIGRDLAARIGGRGMEAAQCLAERGDVELQRLREHHGQRNGVLDVGIRRQRADVMGVIGVGGLALAAEEARKDAHA